MLEHYIDKIFKEKFGCPNTNFRALHWQGDCIAYSMLITVLYLMRSKDHWELSLHKKWSFPLRISSVNVTKSAVPFHFLCSAWNEVGSQTLTKCIISVETKNLWTRSWCSGLWLLDLEIWWLAPRLTQHFIFPWSMKWILGAPGGLVVKSKRSPCSGSVALRQLNSIHKLIFEALIYCAYTNHTNFGK